MTNYLDRQGHWQDWAETGVTALAAAIRDGDPSAEAEARRGLARVQIRDRRLDEARANLERALALDVSCGDHIGAAHAHLILSTVDERQERLADALEHAKRALARFEAVGHVAGQGNALNSIGWYLAQLGAHRAALDYCERALALRTRSATATSRPAPGTQWGSPTTTSASTGMPPTAFGGRLRCGGTSATGTTRPKPRPDSATHCSPQAKRKRPAPPGGRP
jgi:tetratricopeptide (TPR) repeat protein